MEDYMDIATSRRFLFFLSVALFCCEASNVRIGVETRIISFCRCHKIITEVFLLIINLRV